MSPAILIFLALIATAVLAYLIVNKIPKKFHPIISIVFLGLIFWLVSLIYNSILDPIRFKKEKENRYSKVIDNLKMIRDAQVAHRKIKGGYIVSPQDLISFVDTAKFPILETVTKTKMVNLNGLKVSREYKVTNTIGYTPVVDDFKNRDYKNMFNIPNSTEKIQMAVDSITSNDYTSQVFKASVTKNTVLSGMDKKMIANENKAEGGITIKGTEISVGSLKSVKVVGNWPPLYDNKK